MQCSTDLAKLRDALLFRVGSLKLIVSPIHDASDQESRRCLAFVTIELDNLIILGLRQYTKSSLLRSRTAAGSRITAMITPSSPEEAAAYIYRSLNSKAYAKMKSPRTISEKNEIVFRDPRSVDKVFRDYATSNIANLNLALSLNANVFSEAKICRHFFAHRTKNTYEAVREFANRLGIIGAATPEHLLLRGRPGTGVRILDGWLSDIENFFDLAT